MKNLQYDYFTDINMNTIAIGRIPAGFKLRDDIKQVTIQSYGDFSFDIILERNLKPFFMQGTFFGKDINAVITGFKIVDKTQSVRIHLKSSRNAKSLESAKKLYKVILKQSLEEIK